MDFAFHATQHPKTNKSRTGGDSTRAAFGMTGEFRSFGAGYVVGISQALETGGNAHEQGLLLLSKLLVRHAQDLDALNNAHDLVNEHDYAAGYKAQNDAQDTGLDLAGHEAGNAVAIEDQGHDTEQNSVFHDRNLFSRSFTLL